MIRASILLGETHHEPANPINRALREREGWHVLFMKTILVPVDFSDVTPALAEMVGQLAQAFQSKIILLHVAAYGIGAVSPTLMPVPIESDVNMPGLQESLDEVKTHFAGSLQDVETVLIDGGSVTNNILSECETLHADLIVMGSHGHGMLYNLLTGSVTAGVVKSAKCPVLVVPSPQGKLLAAA